MGRPNLIAPRAMTVTCHTPCVWQNRYWDRGESMSVPMGGVFPPHFDPPIQHIEDAAAHYEQAIRPSESPQTPPVKRGRKRKAG